MNRNKASAKSIHIGAVKKRMTVNCLNGILVIKIVSEHYSRAIKQKTASSIVLFFDI